MLRLVLVGVIAACTHLSYMSCSATCHVHQSHDTILQACTLLPYIACTQHLEPDPLSAPVSGASPSSQTQQLQAAWRAEQQHATAAGYSNNTNTDDNTADNDSEADDDDDGDDDVSATSDRDGGSRTLQNGEEQEEEQEDEEDSDAPSRDDDDDVSATSEREGDSPQEGSQEPHSPTAAERARAAQRTLQALALGSSSYLGDAPRREGYLYKQRDTLQTRWSYRRRYFVLGESSSSGAMQLSFYKSKEVSYSIRWCLC